MFPIFLFAKSGNPKCEASQVKMYLGLNGAGAEGHL